MSVLFPRVHLLGSRMEQKTRDREGGGRATLSLRKRAMKLPQCRRICAPERRRSTRTPDMFARLLQQLRRWIGYRPERRYMRGGSR